MEENQTTENYGQQVSPSAPSVSEIGFPSAQQPSQGGSKKWIFVILGVLLVAVGGIFFLSKRSAQSPEATPQSEVSGESVESTPSELSTPQSSASPTATPASSADKSKVNIQVQNGTGITGEAAYLQTQLKSLGYLSIKVGNASSTGVATTVTFAKSVPSSVVDEITGKLQDIYQTVTAKTVTTSTYDVVVVTGLKKGATSKPQASPTATP
ncbi:LytR C-terminal domain-containing protein [Candidatus Woesebacteria bacterium]|nr:LytR C-terminal domain-containing protein [Candidatus Woesebacteria bacterium]